MTDKQKRFCEEYILDCNATQAAIRAGYSKKTASETGYENLNKPQIMQRIKELQEITSNELKITFERQIEDLEEIKREAMEENQFSAAIKAIEVQNKMLGLFKEHNDQKKSERNIQDLKETLDELLERRSRLRRV